MNQPDEFELVHLYVDKKWTLRQIASHFGVAYNVARAWLQAAGIPMKLRGPRTESAKAAMYETLLRAAKIGSTEQQHAKVIMMTVRDALDERHLSLQVPIDVLPDAVRVRLALIRAKVARLDAEIERTKVLPQFSAPLIRRRKNAVQEIAVLSTLLARLGTTTK